MLIQPFYLFLICWMIIGLSIQASLILVKRPTLNGCWFKQPELLPVSRS